MTRRYGCSHSQHGFSLIEMMISVGLFLLVLSGIFKLFESSRSSYASGEKKADVQTNARVAMDEIARQVRMAGYISENFDTNAANDIANGVPIHMATDSALAIFGDADQSGVSSILLFCLSGTTLRRVSAATANVAAYTCSGGEVLADNITSLRFAYYAADSTTLPATPTPPYQLDGQSLGAVPSFSDLTLRGAVRRMVITITGTKNNPRRLPEIYTLTSDVRLRNVN